MNQETASNFGILALAVMFGVLGWINNHALMRHGLFAAATWSGGAFTARILRELGLFSVEQVRLFNGAFAWVVVVILVTTLATEWLVERRARDGV